MGRVPYIRYPLSLCGKARFGKDGLFYMNRQEERQTEQEIREKEDRGLKEYGQMTLEENGKKRKIHLLSIIGGGRTRKQPRFFQKHPIRSCASQTGPDRR